MIADASVLVIPIIRVDDPVGNIFAWFLTPQSGANIFHREAVDIDARTVRHETCRR